ncbi:MAG TPA: hypothetical protein VF468_08265 [Actinomycetota bacterium]|nr:hypothetical protein [Actinomycetota bacterium]
MAGMAEGYWKELRPSGAARLRLDVTIHDDQEPSARDLRRRQRQRQTARSRVRAAASRS